MYIYKLSALGVPKLSQSDGNFICIHSLLKLESQIAQARAFLMQNRPGRLLWPPTLQSPVAEFGRRKATIVTHGHGGKNPGEFVDFDHQVLTVLTFDSDVKKKHV